jgi:enterochelin esterase-like enzyme
VSIERLAGPVVSEKAVEFEVVDPALRSVALLHELRRPRRVEFQPEDGAWRLTYPRPAGADRLEYLLEFTYRTGRVSVAADLTNPLRAPGPFGNKSVIEFPGYEQPEWVSDDDAAPGTLRELPLETLRLSQTLPTLLWSAADTDPERPLPLLLVHDGPEYVSLGGLTHYLGAGISAGLLPPTRAVLLSPGDRNAEYSANPAHAAWIADDLVPRLPPATVRIGVGASLGALAMLHLHRSHPDVLDGLFLQSGSFFTAELDPQESGFSGYDAVTKFVTSVHEADADDHPVPATLTCGGLEENLANNAAMTTSLGQLGYASQLIQVRDTHNYTAWRDALHPHLTDVVTTVADARAA